MALCDERIPIYSVFIHIVILIKWRYIIDEIVFIEM